MALASACQLEALYESQAGTLVSSLSRRVGHEAAEDITAEAFIRLASRLNEGGVEDAPALLRVIAHGLLIDHYREVAARPEVLVDFDTQVRRAAAPLAAEGTPRGGGLSEESLAFAREVADALTVPPAGVDDVQFSGAFDTAVRGLPDVDFAAFALTELRGLTTVEAADVLGTSQPTTYRRRERARLVLREELAA